MIVLACYYEDNDTVSDLVEEGVCTVDESGGVGIFSNDVRNERSCCVEHDRETHALNRREHIDEPASVWIRGQEDIRQRARSDNEDGEEERVETVSQPLKHGLVEEKREDQGGDVRDKGR